jgi:hypothetical protein
MSYRKKLRNMKLVSIEEFLIFLETDYLKFREKSTHDQENIQLQNSLVRSQLKQETSLRNLYIDLMMHDSMISHSKTALDKNEQRVRMLITNKVAIQKMIQNREKQGECITPDQQVENVVQLSLKNKQYLKTGLIQWIDPSKRDQFQKEISHVLNQENSHPNKWAEQLMKNCMKHGLLLKKKNLEHFRNFVSFSECLTFYTSSINQNIHGDDIPIKLDAVAKTVEAEALA